MKIDLEYFRFIAVSAFSPILAYFTPTKGFFIALVVMFAFNVIAGMRADGVSIVRCNNFSMRKFKNSLAELLLYIVLLYVYLCNGLKNYVKAYPQNIGLRIIYHVVRVEFTRIMPSYWKPIIERCKEEMENKKEIKG